MATQYQRPDDGARRVDSEAGRRFWERGAGELRSGGTRAWTKRQQLTGPCQRRGETSGAIVGGIREVLVRERVCFQKGCAPNVKKPRMGSFANSSTQKSTLPTGHLRVREVLGGPTEQMGAPHTDDLQKDTCPGHREPPQNIARGFRASTKTQILAGMTGKKES